MTLCYGLVFVIWCEQPLPPPAITACPPLPPWNQSYQAQLADEVEELSEGSALHRQLSEYIRLREQLRRCKN